MYREGEDRKRCELDRTTERQSCDLRQYRIGADVSDGEIVASENGISATEKNRKEKCKAFMLSL